MPPEFETFAARAKFEPAPAVAVAVQPASVPMPSASPQNERRGNCVEDRCSSSSVAELSTEAPSPIAEWLQACTASNRVNNDPDPLRTVALFPAVETQLPCVFPTSSVTSLFSKETLSLCGVVALATHPRGRKLFLKCFAREFYDGLPSIEPRSVPKIPAPKIGKDGRPSAKVVGVVEALALDVTSAFRAPFERLLLVVPDLTHAHGVQAVAPFAASVDAVMAYCDCRADLLDLVACLSARGTEQARGAASHISSKVGQGLKSALSSRAAFALPPGATRSPVLTVIVLVRDPEWDEDEEAIAPSVSLQSGAPLYEDWQQQLVAACAMHAQGTAVRVEVLPVGPSSRSSQPSMVSTTSASLPITAEALFAAFAAGSIECYPATTEPASDSRKEMGREADGALIAAAWYALCRGFFSGPNEDISPLKTRVGIRIAYPRRPATPRQVAEVVATLKHCWRIAADEWF